MPVVTVEIKIESTINLNHSQDDTTRSERTLSRRQPMEWKRLRGSPGSLCEQKTIVTRRRDTVMTVSDFPSQFELAMLPSNDRTVLVQHTQ